MPGLSDTLLEIRAAQGGDRAALENLFARYWPQVLRIVSVRASRPRREIQDLEDIAQEAMLRAFRFFDRFDVERSEGTFRNWLARIVETALVDCVRRRNADKRGERLRTPLVDDSNAPDTPVARDPLPSEAARGKELEDRIAEALSRLTERARELIVLREHCGMDYAEIAEALGLKNADTARALHHRALRGLAALLERG